MAAGSEGSQHPLRVSGQRAGLLAAHLPTDLAGVHCIGQRTRCLRVTVSVGSAFNVQSGCRQAAGLLRCDDKPGGSRQ